MNEFIKIKPIGDVLTGTVFKIQSDDISTKSVITNHSGDSLFTTELKEGDKITFYNSKNKLNLIKKTYTVYSITSNTVLTAIEVSVLDDNLTADQNGKITYYTAIKELDTSYNTYPDKRILKKSIVGYKEDIYFSDISLLDVDPSLVDIDEYDLVSVSTPIKFGGSNQPHLQVMGHCTSNKKIDYKVQIDGAGAAHVTTVTCVADSGGSLNQTGFIFYTISGPVAVVISVNQGDTINAAVTYPSYGFKALIPVYIDAGTSANDVCTAVFNALNDSDLKAVITAFTVSNKSSATFRINNVAKGAVTLAKVLPSMTSSSTGISFSSSDGTSSLTDTNFESDGLDSTVWAEYDRIEIRDSEKNNGFYQVHNRTDGKIIIKGNRFVNEDAGYPVIIKNALFESSGFSFATTVLGSNSTFKWSDTGGEIWNESTVTIKGMHYLSNGVRILFPLLNDYTANDYWTFSFPKPNMIKTRNKITELDNIYKCTNLC